MQHEFFATASNRIHALFAAKRNILNIYFTAGFPQLNDTVRIIKALTRAGVDMIEIGMPFSDPLADGPTIQQSSQRALENGMSIRLLFEQLQHIRQHTNLPLLLMGYLNPVMQFGIENFCQNAREIGIDGLILPDLPMHEYLTEYRPIFERYGLLNIFLITPQTAEARIRQIDELSQQSFIYMVSAASTTGAKQGFTPEQRTYFERIAAMHLKSPKLIGFGIANSATFEEACRYAEGAIIGSAFINLLQQSVDLEADISAFVHALRGG
ncbi:MAG: tryptophan synthase subunit alpha [Cytophagales bacterium]|nr:tryptophan synthase subunit alpha [Bernardetiaceae bacterium]MDW8204645.1 tryptophan synthase subunit alpha [Cytophagales bacterium]